LLAQPKTLEQRVAIANDFTKRFKFPLPFGIDDMSNAANDAYAAWPERIYIIDESGHIAYRGGWARSTISRKKPANGWPRDTEL